MSTKKTISASCHVLTLPLRTDAREEALLGKFFSTGLAFRNSIAGNTTHRIMRLQLNKEYRELKAQLRSIPRGDKSGLRKATETRLKEIRTAYGLGGDFQLQKESTPIKNRYFNTGYLPAPVSQTIVSDIWRGVEKILFSKGKKLSAKKEHDFLSLRGKSNDSAIVFDPCTLSVKIGNLPLHVKNRLDKYQREDLARMMASYLSEKSGGPALPGCIRYCSIVRRLVNDHGTVKWGYWLRVTADGPAPVKANRSNRPATQPQDQHTKRVLAIDPSQAMMSCCSSDGNVFFLLLDGKNPKADARSREVSRRLDQSRRASNPERYNPDGTYRKGSVNARTGKKGDWNTTDNYKALRRRRRLLMQKEGDTLLTRRNRMCNNLTLVYPVVKTEGSDYLALSVRSKRMRTGKGGKIASKKRFGDTIRRFAPSSFLSTLRSKVLAAGGEYVEVNPWTLKASQYDPTSDRCVKHKLSERVFRLSDGTPVQRDLMSALCILSATREKRKDERTRKNVYVDVPDRSFMLESMDWFIPAVELEMRRMQDLSEQQTSPSAIGAGAWTTLLDAAPEEPSEGDAPPSTGEDTRAVNRGHRNGHRSDTRSTARNQADKKRKALKPSAGTPRIHPWE